MNLSSITPSTFDRSPLICSGSVASSLKLDMSHILIVRGALNVARYLPSREKVTR